MILADENISQEIIVAIRNIGIEVYSVYQSNRGISDEEIIKLSRNPLRIILTEDKDFGEWVFSHHIENISVLFLRYNFTETAEMIRILSKILLDNEINMFDKFTTITTKKIRIREL